LQITLRGGEEKIDAGARPMLFEPRDDRGDHVQRVLENAVVYDLMNPAHAHSRGEARLSWYLGKQRPG